MLDGKEPYFINEQGTKWWKNDTLTKYAQEQINTDHAVYEIEDKLGYQTRVLIDKLGIIEEDGSLEAMAYKIDKWAIITNGGIES
jgi:hypothetical protein